MSGFTIDITNKVDLGDLNQKIQEIVNDELNNFGIETVADAKLNATAKVDNGFLRREISFDKGDLFVDIIVNVPYAAYVEFGTGVFAAAYVPSLPPDVQAYALTFFVNGKGRIPATPYLFPAIFKNIILLIDNLKRQLNA